MYQKTDESGVRPGDSLKTKTNRKEEIYIVWWDKKRVERIKNRLLNGKMINLLYDNIQTIVEEKVGVLNTNNDQTRVITVERIIVNNRRNHLIHQIG